MKRIVKINRNMYLRELLQKGKNIQLKEREDLHQIQNKYYNLIVIKKMIKYIETLILPI